MKKHLTAKTKPDLIKIDILTKLVTLFFKSQILMTELKKINAPQQGHCIYAMWHSHQFGCYGLSNRDKLHILISQSNDGEIISRATEAVGIKTIRGSHRREGTRATIQLLEKLEMGDNIGITVDGPKGPARECKMGIVTIAKLSSVPIVPVIWYSKYFNFFKFKLSWDDLRFPFLPCRTILSYGEPIYVPSDISNEQMEEYRLKVENSLKNLYKDAQENIHAYLKK